MADKVPVTVRTRKFLRNTLLARRQMVRRVLLYRSLGLADVDLTVYGSVDGCVRRLWK